METVFLMNEKTTHFDVFMIEVYKDFLEETLNFSRIKLGMNIQITISLLQE